MLLSQIDGLVEISPQELVVVCIVGDIDDGQKIKAKFGVDHMEEAVEVMIRMAREKWPRLSFELVVKKAVSELTGDFVMSILDGNHFMVGIKRGFGNKLLVGISEFGLSLATDIESISCIADRVAYVDVDESVVCWKVAQGCKYQITDLKPHKIDRFAFDEEFKKDEEDKKAQLHTKRRASAVLMNDPAVVVHREEFELGLDDQYEHYMLQEICGQQDMFARFLQQEEGLHAHLGSVLGTIVKHLNGTTRILLCAEGLTYHAAEFGKVYLESMARIPVQVNHAMDFFQQNDALVLDTDAVIVLADENLCLTELDLSRIRKRAVVIGLGSVTCESNLFIDLRRYVGTEELGTIQTKTFTAQIFALYLLALTLGKDRGYVSSVDDQLQSLKTLPAMIQQVVADNNRQQIKSIAKPHRFARSFLFLGHGQQQTIMASSGAHFLREIGGIHSYGASAMQMKNSNTFNNSNNEAVPIFLIGENQFDLKGNIIEQQQIDAHSTCASQNPLASTLVSLIQMQLFAYYLGVCRGSCVDRVQSY